MNGQVKDFIRGQLARWDLARDNYAALSAVQTKALDVAGMPFEVQFNPARIVSSGAKVDAKTIGERRCFLCSAHLPAEQESIPFADRYLILVNPFPIFPQHLTIPDAEHTDQRIEGRFGDMLDLARRLTDFTIFYNGPKCGASAPDHMHFQAGSRGVMPIEATWHSQVTARQEHEGAVLHLLGDSPRTALVIRSADKEAATRLFERVCRSLPLKSGDAEPMMNLLAWYESGAWTVCLFPRAQHRPTCYSAEGEANLLSSSASVDLGGLFIMPLEKDFRKITASDVAGILGEVCLPASEVKQIMNGLR